MFEFIEGNVVERTPAHVIVENNGLGYFINISLFSYSSLPAEGKVRVYIHQVIREDANILFGFVKQEEREVFRQLISVSGIGANTARVILSSLSPEEVIQSIQEGNVPVLQSIKGIGGKTAQRIIVDLKDKITKAGGIDDLFLSERNTIRDESLSALVALGFAKKQVEKVVGNLIRQQPELEVEEIVKQALKLL